MLITLDEKIAAELIKMPIEEIIGVFQVAGVTFDSESGDELLEQFFARLEKFSRKRKRNLLKLMRSANKGR